MSRFDCNGVLVDSEPIAAAVAAAEFARIGIPITPEQVVTYFFGRRPDDMLAVVERATRRRLPPGFSATLADDHESRASAPSGTALDCVIESPPRQ